MKMNWRVLLFYLILISCLHYHLAYSRGVNGGFPCAVCTVGVGLLEQYTEINNVTVIQALDNFCNILPKEYYKTCATAVDIFGALLFYMLERKETPDTICYSLNFCHVDPGQQMCHLFPPTAYMSLHYIEKFKYKLKTTHDKYYNFQKQNFAPCDIPGIKQLCYWLERVFSHQNPGIDRDGDLFSTYKTYRGSTWRGKDCNDNDEWIYPGRRPIDEDINEDSNCNGIHGINPYSGIPYEKEFCSIPSLGFITIGDSISAHFHVPPQWSNPASLNKEVLKNLTFVLSNEIDWPHLSYATGYINNTWSIVEGITDSIYLKLKERDRCIHRDFQNIAVNGAMAKDFVNLNGRLKRNKTMDKPALVLYAVQGNDVCNSYRDTLKYITPPTVFRQEVLKTLFQLDKMLPAGSQVLLLELIDGSMLYDALAKRLHPIGYLHKDVTYANMFDWWNCMEKAVELSEQLKDIAEKYKFKSFDIHYITNPIKKVIKIWESEGNPIWQLIEEVDALHPNQIAHALVAEVLWKEILKCCSNLIGEINPFNEEIIKIFGDQGGY